MAQLLARSARVSEQPLLEVEHQLEQVIGRRQLNDRVGVPFERRQLVPLSVGGALEAAELLRNSRRAVPVRDERDELVDLAQHHIELPPPFAQFAAVDQEVAALRVADVIGDHGARRVAVAEPFDVGIFRVEHHAAVARGMAGDEATCRDGPCFAH